MTDQTPVERTVPKQCNKRKRPELTLVLPSFEEGHTIGANVLAIAKTMERANIDYELVVVLDGDADGSSARVLRQITTKSSHAGAIVVKSHGGNMGKGRAIITGLQGARAEYVGWLDSDLEIPPDVIVSYLTLLKINPTISGVIGSKRAAGSLVVYPWLRRVYSFAYQMLTRLLFKVNVRDTQVGAKVFRATVSNDVLSTLVVKRYAFDLEFLVAARTRGHPPVVEEPVVINHAFSGSSVDWRGVARTLWDTMAIAYRLYWVGQYRR